MTPSPPHDQQDLEQHEAEEVGSRTRAFTLEPYRTAPSPSLRLCACRITDSSTGFPRAQLK